MKKILFGIVILLFLLTCFILYIMCSTGFFRKIENSFAGSIYKRISVPGVEDMQIAYKDDFMLLSSDDRAERRNGTASHGHLYYIDLTNTSFEPRQLTSHLNIPFFPHGISMYRTGPKHYKVYAINHVKGIHSIEVFELYADSLVHVHTLQDPSMISPNDIVAIGAEQFYFTNDHAFTEGLGKLAEDYLGLEVSNVVLYNGETYREVADGIGYANGINVDGERDLLFVASSRKFIVKVFHQQGNGNLEFIEDIACKTGVDNIEFDSKGKMWIGGHPSLLAFTAYASGKKPIAPSEVITIDYRDKGDFVKEVIFVDDGRTISASSVACPYDNYIFVGDVMDDHFLILKKD